MTGFCLPQFCDLLITVHVLHGSTCPSDAVVIKPRYGVLVISWIISLCIFAKL